MAGDAGDALDIEDTVDRDAPACPASYRGLVDAGGMGQFDEPHASFPKGRLKRNHAMIVAQLATSVNADRCLMR